MPEFFLAPALEQLRSEVNRRFPDRDKASDGWVGDTSHQARPSDHNPCWDCPGKWEGIVRALDIDISPDGRPNVDLRRRLLRVTVGDPRVWYVISNGKIYSRTNNWEPRAYTGPNGHFAHVHVSLNGANGVNPEGNFDTSAWFPVRRPSASRPRLNNFRKSRPNWDVKILRRMLDHGAVRMREKIKAIDEAVEGLPDDVKDTRVKEFKEHYENTGVLKMTLLNEAVEEGRSGRVKTQRDKLRTVIKSVLR